MCRKNVGMLNKGLDAYLTIGRVMFVAELMLIRLGCCV